MDTNQVLFQQNAVAWRASSVVNHVYFVLYYVTKFLTLVIKGPILGKHACISIGFSYLSCDNHLDGLVEDYSNSSALAVE